MPRLLERGAELAVLDEALDAALDGQGSVAVILGEAGIGKTSVLRMFMAAAKNRARVLSGSCDDLMTPRTLGPIRDAAAAVVGPMATALAAVNRDDLLIALREELSDPARPTVLVVEDVQWADDATVDVLRYLGRRITELPAMLGRRPRPPRCTNSPAAIRSSCPRCWPPAGTTPFRSPLSRRFWAGCTSSTPTPRRPSNSWRSSRRESN
jgi:predicted ATPase